MDTITAPFLGAIDVVNGGLGFVAGTVKEKSLPFNTPLRRRVVLLKAVGFGVIRETWSDIESGFYRFDHVNQNIKYIVMALDHAGIYRGVVADNVTPEII